MHIVPVTISHITPVVLDIDDKKSTRIVRPTFSIITELDSISSTKDVNLGNAAATKHLIN